MASGTMDVPAADGDAVPATIKGTYAIVGSVIDPMGGEWAKGKGSAVGDPLPPGPPPPPTPCAVPVTLSVTVTVTRSGEAVRNPVVTLKCKTNTTGDWSCPQPNDLTAGKSDYVITAVISDTAGSTTITRLNLTT